MNILGVLPYWQIGPWKPFGLVTIYSFGLCVALGLLIGMNYLAYRAQKRFGIHGEEVQNFSIFLVIIGWPLSHVFNVIFYEPHVLSENPLELFRIWGSISSYGGLLGGVLAFFIWTHRHKEHDRMLWADIGAFGLVIPWFFGRIGCATVHDHPGSLVHDFWLWDLLRPILGGDALWPLAINFPTTRILPGGPRHDLGFYEAMWWGGILLIVLFLDRKPRPKGFFAALVPLMYAPGRFMFDFLRVPPELGGDKRYFGLTPAQYLSVVIFVVGIAILLKIRNKPAIAWQEWKADHDKQEHNNANDSKKSASNHKTKGSKTTEENHHLKGASLREQRSEAKTKRIRLMTSAKSSTKSTATASEKSDDEDPHPSLLETSRRSSTATKKAPKKKAPKKKRKKK